MRPRYIALSLLIAGSSAIATEELSDTERQFLTQIQQSEKNCMERIDRIKGISTLRTKTQTEFITRTAPSLPFISNNSKATPQERDIVAKLDEAHTECYKEALAARSLVFSREILQLDETIMREAREMRAELYSGAISWGEYNKKRYAHTLQASQRYEDLRSQLAAQFRAMRQEEETRRRAEQQTEQQREQTERYLATLRRQQEAESAAARRQIELQEQALQQQQNQALFLQGMQLLQNSQPRPLYTTPPVNTTCYTVGSYLNCNSR